jgi:hypothetical protein
VSADEYERHVPKCLGKADGWPLSDWLGPGAGGVLREWLTEPGAWPKSEPLTEESWPRLRFKARAIVNEWALSVRLAETGAALVPWRQARIMSRLVPGAPFGSRLLEHYRESLDFGMGIEMSPSGRLRMALAVVAHRAGAEPAAERMLDQAAAQAHRSLAARNKVVSRSPYP